MTLAVSRSTTQVFCWMLLCWNFLIVRLGLWVFWKEDHRSKVPFSSHIKCTYYQLGISLVVSTVMAGVVFVRFLQCKVTPYSHIVCYTQEGSHPQSLQLRSGDLCFIFLRAEYLCRLFGILHRLVSFHLFIYLFSHVDLRIHWVIIQYYFVYFMAHSISVPAIGSFFSWLLCLLDITSFFFFLLNKMLQTHLVSVLHQS